MSEFQTLLARIDDVRAAVDGLSLAFARHCQAEESTKAAESAAIARRARRIPLVAAAAALVSTATAVASLLLR